MTGKEESSRRPAARRRFKLAEGDNESVVGGEAAEPKEEKRRTRIDPRDLSGIDPIHTERRPSLLSVEAPFSQQNFRGFYTLSGLILVWKRITCFFNIDKWA
jgi:hypothetical protein